jgi:glycerate kinase
VRAGTPVLVAPDSFKGTFAAPKVAGAIGRGLERVGIPGDLCPIADGGEGTLDVLLAALRGRASEVAVAGPGGHPVRARLGLLADGATAVVEAAQAAGLGLVEPADRDPEQATTQGVGELIVAAARAGAERVLVTVGGTATTDGGEGAVDAVRDAGGLGGLELMVLCDVTTRFAGAARVFAPQKGADAAAVARLEARLNSLAAAYPRDPRTVPGSGAGGGLAGGLWAALGAELVPGAREVLELIGFRDRLEGARSLVVGEGTLDAQTEAGKAVAESSSQARALGVRVDAIVGRSLLDEDGERRLDLASVREATTLPEIEAAAAELGAEL